MSKTSYQIAKGLAGRRLDRVLQIFTGQSRKKAKFLLDHGRVSVNGRKVVIASWEMKSGDHIEVLPEETETVDVQPDAAKYFLKVVREDADLLVVEKDAGVPCEPTTFSTKPTIVSIINAYLKRRYPHLRHHYVGLVHRLDQDTSGLMVYTKTKEGNKIADQFKNHTIVRKYQAIVEGRIERDQGTIEGFLKKSALLKGGKKVAVSTEAAGQKAITHFRVLERYAGATLVEIKLNTGRTHQIRVHMAGLGHPIVGDRIYGDPRSKIKFGRQALHAGFLGFRHPITGNKMEFQAELPKDMRKLVDKLRLHS